MSDRSQPLRAGLFLVGSVGVFILGLGSTQAQLAGDKSSPNPVKLRMEFAPQTGYDAEVIAISGIGTTKATASILLDWDQEVHRCAAQYLGDVVPDPEGNARCVAYEKDHFTGTKILKTTANCETGEMFGFGDATSQFYVGRDIVNSEYMGKKNSYFIDYFDYEGFRVPGNNSTNVTVDGKNFRKLCPNSFLGPPKTNPPELHLSIDCNAAIEDAEQLLTESGLPHIMNLKIIDAWEIKDEGQNLYEAKCSAKIAFNTGQEAKLEFKLVPRHGKYFLQAYIVH